MKRMSPPTGVQARPVATPAVLVRSATSDSKRRAPRMSCTACSSMSTLRRRAFGDPHGDIAQHRADLALQVADARFPGVVRDDLGQGAVADAHLLVVQAVGLQLPVDEVAPADLQLLLLGVAGQLDDLHPVPQRARGWCRAGWPWPRRTPWTGRRARRGSCPGTCRSAPGPAPRAGPMTDRRGSRRRACPSRPA